MGSFNIACSVSGIPITWGSRVMYQFLVPALYRREYETPDNMISPRGDTFVTNDGVYYYYHPFCLPLRGTYDDYGRIEFDDNPAIAALEEYLNCPFELLIKTLSSPRNCSLPTDVNPWAHVLQGSFIHEEVYNALSDTSYTTEVGDNLAGSMGSYSILSTLGFTHVNPEYMPTFEKGEERYYQIWEHPNHLGKRIQSDGSWIKSGMFYPEKLIEEFPSIEPIFTKDWEGFQLREMKFSYNVWVRKLEEYRDSYKEDLANPALLTTFLPNNWKAGAMLSITRIIKHGYQFPFFINKMQAGNKGWSHKTFKEPLTKIDNYCYALYDIYKGDIDTFGPQILSAAAFYRNNSLLQKMLLPSPMANQEFPLEPWKKLSQGISKVIQQEQENYDESLLDY